MSAVYAILDRLGVVFLKTFEQTGLWFRMLGRTVAWIFRRPFEPGEWFRQMVRVGRHKSIRFNPHGQSSPPSGPVGVATGVVT